MIPGEVLEQAMRLTPLLLVLVGVFSAAPLDLQDDSSQRL
jgi:hypothetical protein